MPIKIHTKKHHKKHPKPYTMNKFFGITITILALLVAACASDPKTTDNVAALDALKKQQTEIKAKIDALEAEIAKANPEAANKNAKDVAVTEIKTENFVSYIEVQGMVDARQNIDVSAKAPGTVTQILVKQGSVVRQGQLLATMDDEIVRKGLTELQTQITFANQLFDKQKALWEQNIGTEVQYLTAKNQKEALEQRMESLKEQQDMMRLRAPISGTVDMVNIKLGQMVAPGMPAIKVVNLSDMRIVSDLAENYIGQVKAGNPVMVSAGGGEVPMKIDYVGKVINPINRTFTAEISLKGNQTFFKPNMTTSLKIADYNKANAITIPVNLLQTDGTQQYVLVAETTDNGKTHTAAQRNITTGKSYNGKIVVETGLNPGDKIITVGQGELINGQAIKF
jgi:RND family efflux transporter MFP subunit